MGVLDQHVTDRYALYNGDCVEVMADLPDGSVHLSVYSPPFATEGGGALYHYSSSERDLSNARSYDEFAEHYGYVIDELHRLTMPGRMTAVHCTDVPLSNTGRGDTLLRFGFLSKHIQLIALELFEHFARPRQSRRRHARQPRHLDAV